MNLPKDLYYTKDHEWIKKEGNKIRIGITDFAQDELGDVVFVEMPEEDDTFDADESFGSVESVKTVSELYAPVSGKIVEVNEELEDSPELVNESPYDEAWMLVMEPNDPEDVDKLLTADQYEKTISEE